MAEYNNLSIDIDLEDMFDNLTEDGQEKFLIDMFTNLPGAEERKKECGKGKYVVSRRR